MVDQVDNIANKQMHHGNKTPVGVIQAAPQSLPKKVIYSGKEAMDLYNKLQYDIYQSELHTKAKDKRKFPTVLKIVFGTLATASAIIFRKDIVKFVQNIFKKPV